MVFVGGRLYLWCLCAGVRVERSFLGVSWVDCWVVFGIGFVVV